MAEIRFTYVPTEAHWRWLLETVYQRRWFALRVVGFLSIAIGLLFTAGSDSPYWPLLVIVGTVALMLPALSMRLTARRMAGHIAYGERQVILSDDGIQMLTPVSRSWYALSQIQQVVPSKNGWIILAIGGFGTIIPRDALTATQIEQLESFLSAVAVTERNPPEDKRSGINRRL